MVINILSVLVDYLWFPSSMSSRGEPKRRAFIRAMVSRSRENYVDNWTPRVDSDFHGGWKSKFELRSISKQHSCIYTLYSNFHSVPDSAMHAIRPRVSVISHNAPKKRRYIEFSDKIGTGVADSGHRFRRQMICDRPLRVRSPAAREMQNWTMPSWRTFILKFMNIYFYAPMAEKSATTVCRRYMEACDGH